MLRKLRHYPKELNTLGDHIRTKRLDLDLEQKEVALLFKINHETIKNWENNNTKPGIKYYPAIMNFLGYCPYVRPETWGEELKLHRIHQGLSHRRLSKIIDVDPCTIGYWEKGGNPTWEGKGKREKGSSLSLALLLKNYFKRISAYPIVYIEWLRQYGLS